jgi:diketogulonate reductase-like aldo/keto reductase
MEFKELGRSGTKIPVLGLGTWGIGGFSSMHAVEDSESIEALRLGFKLDMRFIDTAEMYARGHSEEVVAKAVQDQRANVFIATKVSPEHLSREAVLRACESSLWRLRTDYIDLYQVHWPNPRIPISETMKAMEQLVSEGKVRNIGVSNFSRHQTQEAQTVLSRASLASNQVEYSLLERSIEDELLPYCERERITIIAYSPIAKGEIARGKGGERWRVLDHVASENEKTRIQAALNWLISKSPVVAIPKAGSQKHVVENAGSVGWALSAENVHALDEAFK